MLQYKVLVIKRNDLLIGHMFDFDSKIENRKYLHTLLKEAQSFNPYFTGLPILIL